MYVSIKNLDNQEVVIFGKDDTEVECNYYRSSDGRNMVTVIAEYNPKKKTIDSQVDSFITSKIAVTLLTNEDVELFTKEGTVGSYMMNDKDFPGKIVERLEIYV
jgi:hypothetical protein